MGWSKWASYGGGVLLTCLMGCGAGAPGRVAASAAARGPAATPPPLAQPAEPTPAPEPVRIKGLTGTLNKDDVHQTMEARQPALDACIMRSRRRLRWVSGTIRFAFAVDGEGAVAEVRPTESDLGHFVLETCIHDVLAQTHFPKPAGRATARFDWGLSVEPATSRALDTLEPEQLEPVLRKNAREILTRCEVRRWRERFTVTAYVNRRGRIISAGAVPRFARSADKVECILEALTELRLPKGRRNAKVSFVLRR